MTHDTAGADTNFTITIPANKVFADGTDFAAYLQAEMNSGGRSGYVVAFELEDGATLTISNPSFLFSIRYDLTPRGWTKAGFTESSIGVATATGNQNINLVRTSVVTVHTNIADGDCLTSIEHDRRDISLVVPITTTFGGIISFSSSNDRVISEQISGIQTISLVLRDDEGDRIGLSTTSYVSMELAIEYNDLTKPTGADDLRAPLPTMSSYM